MKNIFPLYVVNCPTNCVAVTVTPRMPWKLTFWPVRYRFGTGVRGSRKVVITWSQSLRMP